MNKQTRNISFLSLFIAIELLMIVIPFLGYIPVGPLRATTLHIPVLIAGIVLGKKQGMILGLIFGMSSIIINTIQPTLTSFVFSPFISGSFLSLLIAIIPRMLIGYLAGLIHEKLKDKHQSVAIITGSLMGSLANTALVLGGIYFLFGNQYANVLNMNFDQLLPYLLGIIATNGLLEAVLGSCIVMIVSRILIHIY